MVLAIAPFINFETQCTHPQRAIYLWRRVVALRVAVLYSLSPIALPVHSADFVKSSGPVACRVGLTCPARRRFRCSIFDSSRSCCRTLYFNRSRSLSNFCSPHHCAVLLRIGMNPIGRIRPRAQEAPLIALVYRGTSSRIIRIDVTSNESQ